MPNFSGIWNAAQQFQARGQNIWPAPPGAPTIGTATVASGTSVSVAFTAPANTGYPAGVTGYTATSSPGGITNTGASSPIIVSGLTTGTAYTFTVTATGASGTGPASAASNSATPAVIGQQAYTTPGLYTFVVPTGVTLVSTVTVGAGARGCMGGVPRGGGGGGALAYANSIAVTPGESLSVRVAFASGGCYACGTANPSYLRRSGTNLVAAGSGNYGGNNGTGGTVVAGTGFSGGKGGAGSTAGFGTGGGGGAGGYAGAGGAGGYYCGSVGSTAGTGGAGGGGGYGAPVGGSANNKGGGAGGGVGILGQGTNGTAGASCSSLGGTGGGGGSGGTAGQNGQGLGGGVSRNSQGGAYGGGGGGGCQVANFGGGGAVRIIYPGNTRSFPSTCTGNL